MNNKRSKPKPQLGPVDSGGVFNDVHLAWKGAKFIIPSDKVMGAIARIEQFITLKELLEMMTGGSPKLASLSQAYSAVLRYAGCNVTVEDIYVGMFGEEKEQQISLAFIALNGLLSMMIPPKSMQEMRHRVTTSGESQGRPSSEDAASSSPKPLKQPIPGV